MKRESLGWFVAGAMIVLTCTLGAMQQQGSVGRFQLVEGKYQIVGKEKIVDGVSVWRIDTVTGETVYYHSVIVGDDPGVGWREVIDFPYKR
jgi:hypothetical protein